MTAPTLITTRVKSMHDRFIQLWEVPTGVSLNGYPAYVLPTYDVALGNSSAAASQRGCVARFTGTIFVTEGPVLSYNFSVFEVDFSVKYYPTQITPFPIQAVPVPVGSGGFPTNVNATYSDFGSSIPNYSVVGELVGSTQPRVYFTFNNVPHGSATAYVQFLLDVYISQAQV